MLLPQLLSSGWNAPGFAQPLSVSTPGPSLRGDRLQGPVRSIAIDSTGHHMVTSGVDGEVKVWDVRTFKPLHHYFSRAPATSLDISQQGLLAVGFGSKVQVQGVQPMFPVSCPLVLPALQSSEAYIDPLAGLEGRAVEEAAVAVHELCRPRCPAELPLLPLRGDQPHRPCPWRGERLKSRACSHCITSESCRCLAGCAGHWPWRRRVNDAGAWGWGAQL